ncbi:anticodon nuclease, partial [Pseudomonas sp. NZIPFR-PS5]
MKPGQPFVDLPELAAHLRQELENKKAVLLYAYNGTGKTRLSMAFKEFGKQDDARDTLYFNAFTEDLFHWDNDLDGDSDRKLKLNANSRFFAALAELEMDNRIRPLLRRYADFDFRIDTKEWSVRFSRTVTVKAEGDGEDTTVAIDNIKVSRGEENIFVWCFFLAVVELAMDPEIEAYRWVKYLYIDDPISSLDEHNAIAVANHLAHLLKRPESQLRTVVSTHHTLFFNVLCNELSKARKYVVNKTSVGNTYVLREETGDTPFFHHVAALAELYLAA